MGFATWNEAAATVRDRVEETSPLPFSPRGELKD